jgi:hypothetical protein
LVESVTTIMSRCGEMMIPLPFEPIAGRHRDMSPNVSGPTATPVGPSSSCSSTAGPSLRKPTSRHGAVVGQPVRRALSRRRSPVTGPKTTSARAPSALAITTVTMVGPSPLGTRASSASGPSVSQVGGGAGARSTRAASARPMPYSGCHSATRASRGASTASTEPTAGSPVSLTTAIA